MNEPPRRAAGHGAAALPAMDNQPRQTARRGAGADASQGHQSVVVLSHEDGRRRSGVGGAECAARVAVKHKQAQKWTFVVWDASLGYVSLRIHQLERYSLAGAWEVKSDSRL